MKVSVKNADSIYVMGFAIRDHLFLMERITPNYKIIKYVYIFQQNILPTKSKVSLYEKCPNTGFPVIKDGAFLRK